MWVPHSTYIDIDWHRDVKSCQTVQFHYITLHYLTIWCVWSDRTPDTILCYVELYHVNFHIVNSFHMMSHTIIVCKKSRIIFLITCACRCKFNSNLFFKALHWGKRTPNRPEKVYLFHTWILFSHSNPWNVWREEACRRCIDLQQFKIWAKWRKEE